MATNRYRLPPAPKIAVVLGLLAVAWALDVGGTVARADWRQLAPWCAAQGGTVGASDCSYHTFEQCMATARGLGGYCSPNPRVIFAPARGPRRSQQYR